MKKSLFFISIALIFANADSMVNSVIATVNNEPITNYELALVKKMNKNISNEQAFEMLVDDKIRTSEIKKRGIMVNSYEIDNRINAIATQNNMNLEQFKQALKKDGIDFENFKKDLRKAIAEEKMMNQVYMDIQRGITKEKVENFYNNNISLFTEFDTVTLTRYLSKNRDALVKITQNKNAKPAGVNITKGTLSSDKMDQGLKYVVINVKEGEFSPIIQTKNGFEMFFINSKNGIRTMDFESVQNYATEAYFASQRQKAAKDFYDRIRSQANIKIINR